KGVVCSPDGKRLYVATGRGNTVVVVDVAHHHVEKEIAVGQRPWGIAMTRDGSKVYTANGLSNDVSVVDTSTDTLVATIKAGAAVNKIVEMLCGILTAMGGCVEVGELVSSAQAGAKFRHSLLWVVVLGTIGIIVYGEMAGRIAAVTKEPVMSIIRARTGFPV